MPPARRKDRLSEFIRQEAAKILLSEVEDPRLKKICVTRAEVSDDIQNAKVYVRVIGTAADQRTAMRALEHATGMIQSEIAHRMETRYTPRITFYIDEDSWQILAADQYDGRGQIWRVSEAHCINYYDAQVFWSTLEVHIDLQNGRYLAIGLDNENEMYDFNLKRTPADYTPDSLRRDGLR